MKRILLLLALAASAWAQISCFPCTGGGGAPPAGSAGNLQTKVDSTHLGASTATGSTPGATFNDSLVVNQVNTDIGVAPSSFYTFGDKVAVGQYTQNATAKFRIYDLHTGVPVLICTITPHTAVSGQTWSPFVFGKFAYFITAPNDGMNPSQWETWDISNLSSPVFVGAIVIPGGNANTDIAIVADDKVYFASQGDILSIYDITNRASPTQLSTLSLALNADGCYSVGPQASIRGPFFYIPCAIMDDTGPIAAIIDVSNPVSPAVVGQVNPTDSSGAQAVTVAGNYMYLAIGTSGDCTVGCSMRIVDIHDPTSPTVVGNYSSGGSLTGFSFAVVVEGNIAYLAFTEGTFACATGTCYIDVVDISNPASPTRITTIPIPATLDLDAIAAYGKFILGGSVNSDDSDGVFSMNEVPGFFIPSLAVGQLRVTDLIVDGDLTVSGSTYSNTMSKIGPQGLGSQGPLGAPAGGNDFRCNNYVLSNNGTSWTVNGMAGAAIAASTTQAVTLFALPGRAKVTSVQSHTTTAWSGTGFVTFVSTIGDSAGGATYYDSGAYNLAASVSNTNFQAVAGLFKSATYAGSNVQAVITGSANLNSNTIAGATDYEVCWVSLP